MLSLATRLIARFLKIPSSALEMFRASNRFSGLNRSTLPVELLPLNTLQISRGLLNFTVLQTLEGWVLPFWAREQYDPRSPAFIPRSHLGLSMNLTHRNWTAVGNPDCAVEPIVDPRGMVTPLPGSWSIDLWLEREGGTLFPSRLERVTQDLLDDLPIVQTQIDLKGLTVTQRVFTEASTLGLQVLFRNAGTRRTRARCAWAIRPMNPEGISLIRTIAYRPEERTLWVNEAHSLHLSETPDLIAFSTHKEGDSAAAFADWRGSRGPASVHCPLGLANGFAGYERHLEPAETWLLELTVPLLAGGSPPRLSLPSCTARWEDLLGRGCVIATPEATLNSLAKASTATLIQLCDGASITPGPATYHQFWFRDAAYMIHALDQMGHAALTDPIVRGFPSRQDRRGYFRSQQGEWDSNGEALWTAWRHALHTHSWETVAASFDSLRRGYEWIRRTRRATKDTSDGASRGLMPPGLSAEHLGLADVYFWDDYWSIAGIEAFARVCEVLGEQALAAEAWKEATAFREDLARAIRGVQERKGLQEIPAGPFRGIDAGMAGSVVACYPLALLAADDPAIVSTLLTLEERFLVDGLFFQGFIHSGGNPYLSLQLGHANLYLGRRERFLSMLRRVAAATTPTRAFPEAIHPVTGGGCMGDGHHGWAAAEMVLALREAFVYERWPRQRGGHELLLLRGIPAEWFAPGTACGISNARVPEGLLSIRTHAEEEGLEIDLDLEPRGEIRSEGWTLILPVGVGRVRDQRGTTIPVDLREGESILRLRPGSSWLVAQRR